MDKSVVIAIIVVVVVLGFPLVAKLAKESGMAQPAQEKTAAAPVALEPPYWNAGNLANTRWTGSFQGISATLSLQPGGVAVLNSDSMMLKMAGLPNTLQGTWSVDGSKFTIDADIPKMGKKSISGTISGKQILDGKGVPLPLTQLQ